MERFLDADELADLRERVAHAADQPEFVTLVARRAARRRRRYTVGGAVAAVVSLLVVVAVVAGTLGRPDAAPPASERRLTSGAEPVAVRFVDALHGFAVAACAPSADCAYQLLATRDGGRSWAYRSIPLRTSDPIRLDAPGRDSVVVSTSGRRLFSTDAGRTWRTLPTSADTTWPGLDAWPVLYVRCPAAGVAECLDGTVVVVDPVTGRDHLLPFAWRGMGAASDDGRLPTPSDGSVWVGATTTDPLRPGLAGVVIRRADGEWRFELLPTAGWVTVLSRDGRTAYALVRAVDSRTLRALYVTGDGGDTWTPVGTRPLAYRGAALLADGSVLLTGSDGRLLRSSDGGRTFAPLAGPALTWIDTANGRYLAGGVDGGWFTSTDGRTWTRLVF